MDSIRININALIVRDEKLLLIKFDDENGVHYNLPGGGLEKGESVIAGLQRECWEEACALVTVKDLCLTWQYVPENENFRFGPRQRLGLIFRAELHKGSEPKLPAKPDTNQIGVEWVSLNDIFTAEKFPLFPEMIPQLKMALAQNRSIELLEASPGSISFKPIDLAKTRDICLKFRHDSFVASFGSDESAWPEKFDGESYLVWLKAKFDRDPFSAVHVWLDDKIIGQLELGKAKDFPDMGYVNLYYLAPEYRGKGHSKSLDEYTARYIKSQGFTKARLCVSPANDRAIAFYKKNGWIDKGPREGYGVHWMEKSL